MLASFSQRFPFCSVSVPDEPRVTELLRWPALVTCFDAQHHHPARPALLLPCPIRRLLAVCWGSLPSRAIPSTPHAPLTAAASSTSLSRERSRLTCGLRFGLLEISTWSTALPAAGRRHGHGDKAGNGRRKLGNGKRTGQMMIQSHDYRTGGGAEFPPRPLFGAVKGTADTAALGPYVAYVGGTGSSFKTRQPGQRESLAGPAPRPVGPAPRRASSDFQHAVITAIRGAAAARPGASLSPASSGSCAGAQRPTQLLEKQSAPHPGPGHGLNEGTPPAPCLPW